MLKKRKNYIPYLSVISAFELIVSGIMTLLISPDPKNAWLFGFSKLRWTLALIIFFFSIVILSIGIISRSKEKTIINILSENKGSFFYRFLWVIVILLIIWGGCTLFFPAYLFGKLANYYERIRPISIALGLITFQLVLTSIDYKRLDLLNNLNGEIKRPFLRTALYISLFFLTIFLFIGFTKIGLVKNIPFWNVSGIPITGLQFLSVLFIVIAIYFLMTKFKRKDSLEKEFNFLRILPFLIYIITVLIWGLTPMVKHFFSLQPLAPNYQPFPWSDARWLDIGSISIIKGFGINFQDGSDKPLYMVYLAGLHFLGGYNYSILTWMQILVLSFIPVVLYFLGKQFLGHDFGVFLALVTILRQRNSIVLSYKIASVNPKLFISETLTFLGIVLFTYVVFLFLKNPKPWLALLAGGLIGTTSLIRLNPLLLFPLIGIISIISIIRLKDKWKLLILYFFGFLMVFSPVLIIDFSSTSKYDPIEKFQMIFKGRYSLTSTYSKQPLLNSFETELFDPGIIDSTNKITNNYSLDNIHSTTLLVVSDFFQTTYNRLLFLADQEFSVLDRLINHYLHNITASIMALPDGTNYDDLEHLRMRPYWVEGSGWKGTLPIVGVLIILINIILLGFGLAYSWHKFHWAGLSPLIIFLGYDLALSFAMTSGSRYIVPIDWILFFYYGVSVIGILRWLIDLFQQKEQDIPKEEFIIKKDEFGKKGLVLTVILLVIIASLIPISNNLIPAIIKPSEKIENYDSIINSIPLSQGKVKNNLVGEVLYPYYNKDSTLDFSLLIGEKINKYSIDISANSLKKFLYGGEVILAGKKNNEIVYIYLVSGSSLELIWSRNSIPE